MRVSKREIRRERGRESWRETEGGREAWPLWSRWIHLRLDFFLGCRSPM
jgi:hypothetical protein